MALDKTVTVIVYLLEALMVVELLATLAVVEAEPLTFGLVVLAYLSEYWWVAAGEEEEGECPNCD